MLPLDDPRWCQFETFFGEPCELPGVIRAWLAAVGTEDEETIYCRDLGEIFLHQGTIVDAAYAVVPWLVRVIEGGKSPHRAWYLDDVIAIERYRIYYEILWDRDRVGGKVVVPDWLRIDYERAIVRARDFVGELVGPGRAEPEDALAFARAILWGGIPELRRRREADGS
jgi:hypothetical protein